MGSWKLRWWTCAAWKDAPFPETPKLHCYLFNLKWHEDSRVLLGTLTSSFGCSWLHSESIIKKKGKDLPIELCTFAPWFWNSFVFISVHVEKTFLPFIILVLSLLGTHQVLGEWGLDVRVYWITGHSADTVCWVWIHMLHILNKGLLFLVLLRGINYIPLWVTWIFFLLKGLRAGDIISLQKMLLLSWYLGAYLKKKSDTYCFCLFYMGRLMLDELIYFSI